MSGSRDEYEQCIWRIKVPSKLFPFTVDTLVERMIAKNSSIFIAVVCDSTCEA